MLFGTHPASQGSVWVCEDNHDPADHNLATVQAQVDASDDGDCVHVPAGDGDVTWASALNVTNKDIQIIGPGSGNLIVRNSAVTIISSAARVTGFQFILRYTQACSGVCDQIFITASQGWRYDHNIIYSAGWHICFYLVGSLSGRTSFGNEGLIDNNTITGCRITVYGEDGTTAGSDRWLTTDTIGTAHTVYIEDNDYTIPDNGGSGNAYGCYQETAPNYGGILCNFVDDNYGGSYVARFNRIHDTYFEGHPTSGNSRGGRFVEVYGNHSSIDVVRRRSDFAHYGTYFTGQMLFWNNTSDHGYSPSDEPNRVDQAPDDGDTRGAMGDCTGSNYVDSNQLGNGWLCRDQPGAGNDATYWLFSMGAPAPAQTKAPSYMWNNPFPGSQLFFQSKDARIAENRDFFNYNASFTGTTGTGRGTLAARPATCTTGVGYFATDQGSWNTSTSNPYGAQQNGADGLLYRCTATNTWTLYYTPYTYPHPLQDAGGAAAVARTRLRLRN